MSIYINKVISDKEDIKNIKNLYLSAFPKEERAPFSLMKSKAVKGNADMLIAKDDDKFIGMAYMICYKNLAYLFYLAVDENSRGKGYGGKILSAIKEMYNGKNIFLAREQLDENADNYSQRVSRHKFYLSNGFSDLSCKIKEAGVIYDTMITGGTVSADEYYSLITQWSGRIIPKIFGMKIIE